MSKVKNNGIKLVDLDNVYYDTLSTWQDFTKNDMGILDIPFDVKWLKLLLNSNINDKITNAIKNIKDKCKENPNLVIFPAPQLVFSTFFITDPEDLKVVILGQDPYFNKIDKRTPYNKLYPDDYRKSIHQHTQAMGLSFSVPDGAPIPPSLISIFNNLMEFGHIDSIPENGNLSLWGLQGCLMLNAFLTVEAGKPKSHEKVWKKVTESMVKYISREFENIVFVLWGGPASKNIIHIDQDKHHVIISSHPSPLGKDKKLSKGKYPSFVENDHFGQINEYLIEKKIRPIVWDVL